MNQFATPTKAELSVIGHFDYVQDGYAYGWAYDSTHPEQRLAVEIVCDGEVVSYGFADQWREDLQPAGIGDGKHMFRLPLSYELFDGQVHTLTAREAKTGASLGDTSHAFGPEIKTHDFDLVSRAQGLQLLQALLTAQQLDVESSKSQNIIRAYKLTAALQETGRLQEALGAWDAIAKALGDNALCHCKRGEVHLLRGEPELALEAYQEAISADDQLHWAYLGVANGRQLLGQFSDAEEALQRAVALQPEEPALQARLEQIQALALPARIDALVADGQREEAIRVLKTLLLAHPEHEIAQAKLGEMLMEQDAADDDLSLPGMQQLQEYQKAQRLLDLILDDAETLLDERASQ